MADWRKATERAARRHGVDPKVLTALVSAESGGNPNARSPAGAQGIAQFMPATAKGYGVTLGDNRISDDLDGAARYLKANLKRTGGDYRAALSIYNSGKPDGYKHIPETKAYVAKIMGAAGSVPAPVRAAGAVSKGATLAGTSPPVTPGGMDRQGLLSQYLATRGQPGGLAALGAGLGSLRAPQATQATSPAPVDRVELGGKLAEYAQRAATIDAKRLPYQWGGGHGGRVDPKRAAPLDCSGAVSAVLGIDPRVSGAFTKWGKPGAGDGKGVVVYANDKHVLMSIGGKFFGTSASNPGGGAGWIPRNKLSPEYLKGFTARHQ